jgi:response regulator RpfG family c-di-GMP phosphodiesterase
MLVDELEEVLRIEAAVGLDEEIVQNGVVSRGEGVAGTVWRHGQSALVPDLDADERFQGLADNTTYRPRSLLSVPLWWEERVVGVVNVNSKANGRAFDEDDQLLLEAMAERIALALESFERYRSGYRRLASVESGVRAMLDVGRDRRTHLREMLVRCGVQTGRELGLDEVHLRALAYALRTYDLGLAQVSTQILRKVSPLTREERARIEDHVQLGAELVADLEPSPKVKKIILHHHENVDGSGYPDGLKGEAIPIGARVVRLVDALSALLHDRPFRPAMRLDEAIDLLQEGVGRRFCPRATPVFLSIVREHEALVHSLHPRARRDGGQPPTIPLEDLRIREH